MAARERDNWDSSAVFVEEYRAPEFWFDRHGREFPPEVNYYVGGNTKFYGAALFRLRPEDFGELRHHGGMSPAWPIGYDDLEPYYGQAEHLYRVHGQHGEDPTEGAASQQYLHPPVQHEPRIQQLSDDLEKQGLHRSTCPSAWTWYRTRPGGRRGRAGASAATGSMASPASWVPSPMRRSCAWSERSSTRAWSCSPTPTCSGWRPIRRAGR